MTSAACVLRVAALSLGAAGQPLLHLQQQQQQQQQRLAPDAHVLDQRLLQRSLSDLRGLHRRTKLSLPPPPCSALKSLVRDLDADHVVPVEARHTRRVRRLHQWLDAARKAVSSSVWTTFCSADNAPGFGRRQAARLQQYFSGGSAAEAAVNAAVSFLLPTQTSTAVFVECAAGDGAIFRLFPARARRLGIDVDVELAKRFGWLASDFLSCSREELGLIHGQTVLVVSNPPFNLAREFLLKALSLANIISMILPIRCRKKDFIDGIKTDLGALQRKVVQVVDIEIPDSMQCFRVPLASESDDRHADLSMDDNLEIRLVKQPTFVQVWIVSNSVSNTLKSLETE